MPIIKGFKGARRKAPRRVDDRGLSVLTCWYRASCCFWTDKRAGVAQLVEHLICNQRVGGSSPSASSRNPKLFRHLGWVACWMRPAALARYAQKYAHSLLGAPLPLLHERHRHSGERIASSS